MNCDCLPFYSNMGDDFQGCNKCGKCVVCCVIAGSCFNCY